MAQKFENYSGLPAHAVLAAVAVSFFLLALWTPLMQDDLVFMAQSADLSRVGEPGGAAAFSWDAWLGHVRLMYVENNGRLANILAPLGAWLLPQWLRALLIGLCSAWIFAVAGRMAFGRWDNWRGLAAMWAVSLAAWPWRDRLMFWDYALNYLSASALLLPFLYLFCKRRPTGRFVALGALCGFFGAWMHDGSALCMAASVGTLAILRRLRLSRGEWAMAAALVLGTAAALASPGEWQRASGEVGSSSLLRNLWVSLRIEPLVSVLAGSAAALPLLPTEQRKKLLGAWRAGGLLPGCALMAFYSFAMSLLLDPSGRYGWQAGVFAAVALFGLWRGVFLKASRGVMNFAALSMACAAAAVMASAISFQHRLWVENGEILAEAEVSETGTVFRDVLSRADEPLLALRLPASEVWRNSFQMACANASRSPRGKMVAVVPEALRGFDVDSLRLLGGNAGVGEYRGYIISIDTVTPFDVPGFLCGAQRSAVCDLVLTAPDGSSSSATFGVYKFRVPRSGGRAVALWGPVSGEVSAASTLR